MRITRFLNVIIAQVISFTSRGILNGLRKTFHWLFSKGSVPVKATFNDVSYTGSLMKCGDASHMLGLLKSIREQIGKGPGDVIEVVVWKDEGERTVEVPAGLQKLMKKEGLLGFFGRLSYTHRKEYCLGLPGPRRKRRGGSHGQGH